MRSSQLVQPYESLIAPEVGIIFGKNFQTNPEGVAIHINGIRYPREGFWPWGKQVMVPPIVFGHCRYLAECGNKEVSFHPAEYDLRKEFKETNFNGQC